MPKDFQANIRINPKVNLKYFRARPLPYIDLPQIEHKLERFIKLEIYQPVASFK